MAIKRFDELKKVQSSLRQDPSCVSMITYWPRCSCSILVTARLVWKGICKSTTALTPFCYARNRKSGGFFFYTFPPHSLHTLSLFSNKSFPALNPVRIENCCCHGGCFSSQHCSDCDVPKSKAMSK